MSNLGMIKSVAGAVISGVGVTYGIAMSGVQGSSAWIVAAVLVVLGFVIAAIPISKRGAR